MDNSKSTIKNIFWKFSERFLAQLITLVVQIVLARFLNPKDFGTVALMTVVIQVLLIFVDSGLGNALIQKKDADELDFSSVFIFNIILGFFIYIIVYFTAPLIALFYNDESITILLRVLAFSVIILGIKNVQQAYVCKTLQFKDFFWATLGGTLTSAVVSIYMAFCGFGVWALISQYMINIFIDTLVLWGIVKWRPKLVFSLKRLKVLLNYGYKLFISYLIDTLYNNLRQLIIGRVYSSADLAFFDRGKQIPFVLIDNVDSSIDAVLFPVMSNVQDDANKVKKITQKAIKVSSYVITPMMFGFIVICDNFVSCILTNKWSPCVPYLRLFCLAFVFWPVHTANLNAIKAMGRSDLFLKLEIIKKTVGIILLLLTAWVSVYAMAISYLVSSFISQFINSWPNKKIIHYSFYQQIKDIFPTIIMSFIMGIVIFFVGEIDFPVGITLVIQIIVGFFVYIIQSIIIKCDSFFYFLNIIKDMKKYISKLQF